MGLKYILLSILTVAIWGINFAVIKLGLKELSPLELCVLRFFLASIPAVFFVKRPAIPFRKIVVYSLLIFVLQFSMLFIAMKLGVSAALASLLLQSQVFFSLFFAVVFFNESPSIWQIVGALIAACGVAVVGNHVDADLTTTGLVFVFIAALGWSMGSMYGKTLGAVNMLSLIIWSSLVAWPALLVITYLVEGTQILHHISMMHASSWMAISYIVYFSTIVGFCIWNYLLQKLPVSTVAPFTLLVPVFGMLGAIVLLGESILAWKLEAAFLVMGGLLINVLGQRHSLKLKTLTPQTR